MGGPQRIRTKKKSVEWKLIKVLEVIEMMMDETRKY